MMSGGLNKRQFLLHLRHVECALMADMAKSAEGSKLSAAMSPEGYTGGYLAALRDVEAVLRHGFPADDRGHWRRAKMAMSSDVKRE